MLCSLLGIQTATILALSFCKEILSISFCKEVDGKRGGPPTPTKKKRMVIAVKRMKNLDRNKK